MLRNDFSTCLDAVYDIVSQLFRGHMVHIVGGRSI
jgi:hypothetical protein